MTFKALTRNKIEEIIQLADRLFPNGSNGSDEASSAGSITSEEIRENARKHGELQRALETLTPEALKELTALMLIGREDGAVQPGEFEDMVKNGPQLNADYVADKQDLAGYLRNGLNLLAFR